MEIDNLAGGLGQEDVNDAAWWDERVRLSVDAVVAPGVEGFVQLETQSDTDGDKYTWGHGSKGLKTCLSAGEAGWSRRHERKA